MTCVRKVVVCPACGSREREEVGPAGTAFACEQGDTFPVHPPYTIVECCNCGLHYKSATPSPETLSRYYETLEFASFSGDWDFPTDREVLRILSGLPIGSRVLDYGCSTGRLLGALGGAYRRYGIEVNANAAAVAAAKGITIVSEDDVGGGSCGPFDAILVTDVFEHLVKPLATLHSITSRLAQGGRLLLVTGLVDSVADRSLVAEYWYFRIYGHLQMLSERHLDWLGKTLELTNEAQVRCSHYRRVWRSYIRQNVQAQLYRTFRRPQSPWARVLVQMPLLGRAATWTNMPLTDQRDDHVVAVLRKPDESGDHDREKD